MQYINKKEKHEYCPNCDMILEDTEICSFCEWRRDNKNKGKKNND
jgi:recombinational DNA repair protein RecR